jgi:hypothetical protein
MYVKQVCPKFPELFSIFIDKVISGKIVELEIFNPSDTVLNTILFADNRSVFSDSEAGLYRAVDKLEILANCFNMRISTTKT